MSSPHIPPLRSGGLMLTYRCDSACRHCAYRCGPAADPAWIADDTLDRALAMLAGEPAFGGLHLAGGEATLDPGRLEHALCRAAHFRVPVDYLETNGGFARDAATARRTFARLRAAGLRAVLVSISPYHNEFIPLRRTLYALEAAREVFGADGVIPWLARFLPMLAKLDPGRPHPLDEFLRVNGLGAGAPGLLRMFPLSTGGRAPEALRAFYAPRPAAAFRGVRCAATLADTTHFHAHEKEVMALVKEHTKPGRLYYTDDWKAYASLKLVGDHVVVQKVKGKPKGKDTINGIEGFWSYAKHWLYNYRGVPRKTFHHYLGEVSFRFNHRDEDLLPLFYRILKRIQLSDLPSCCEKIKSSGTGASV